MCKYLLLALQSIELTEQPNLGKQEDGGIEIYINDRWLSNNVITTTICDHEIELLSIKCSPLRLPRELSCVLIVGVYCPPSNDINTIDTITAHIDQLERKHPNAALKLKAYTQMVTCSTRASRTLYKCYSNIKNAYASKKLPPLGVSDHHLIQLIPTYVQRCKRINPTITKSRLWLAIVKHFKLLSR